MFLLSMLVFTMSRLAPGDPLQSYYGDSAERMGIAEREAARDKLGLNRTIPEQYVIWIKEAAKGNFGISFKYKRSVIDVIKGVYRNTLLLGSLSFVLTFLFAVILGVFCAQREDSVTDRAICKIGTAINCIPSFWIALILMMIFCVRLKILPSSGAYSVGMSGSVINRIEHLLLPVTVMVLSHLWYYAYMIRNKLLSELKQDYVLLCRGKGLSRRAIMYRHCLRNILPSLICIMAMAFPHVVGGSYIVERVFSYPGLGSLSFESAQFHDYNMLMVICLLTGAAVIILNLTAQILSELIDPRMRHSEK